MKIFFSVLIVLSTFYDGFSQTTMVVDANQILTSNNKLIIQTSAGQSLFTGRQFGPTYSAPLGIFRAVTDNPNGTVNYFFDGITNGITNYSVRADGQAYFAGSVGIGKAINTNARLSVVQTAALGTAERNSTLIRTYSGMTASVNGNDFKTSLWLVRNAAGTDWLTGCLHEGVSIDGSYLTPKVDTRTWWERDPYHNIQSWGDQTATYMTLAQGNVGIGTADTKGYRLAVNGKIRATEIKVESSNWPDYVFNPDYTLLPLTEVKSYIDKNHHLPELPSAEVVGEKGVDLGEMNKLLTKKVEELTLYLIQMNEEIQTLKSQRKQSN
jgi:hypothetical protein